MDNEIRSLLLSGPATGRALRERLGISQPTLSRRLAAAQADVARLGRGRSSRYGLYRRIRELPPEQPVYRVARTGESTLIGSVLTLAPDRYWYGDREYLSLPWFLTDMRPQGYLGRLFPQTYSDLRMPDRINDWNEGQALYAIARRGEDMAGNLIVGEESFARWVGNTSSINTVETEHRLENYAQRAVDAVAGRAPGSSAAGEQPKFTSLVRSSSAEQRHVIVKFSGPLNTPSGARWSDLLLAEHLATVVLAEHGRASAQTEFLCDGRRAYLEVSRFDRTGTRGRIGLVSLGALDDEFVGERRGWSESAAALLRARLISPDAARELRFLSAFGALIGNTDMHPGNASFLVHGPMQFELAPSYDMLPMFYAPVRDEVPERVFTPPAPAPTHADQWQAARTVAAVFWQRLAADARASAPFRALAANHASALAA